MSIDKFTIEQYKFFKKHWGPIYLVSGKKPKTKDVMEVLDLDKKTTKAIMKNHKKLAKKLGTPTKSELTEWLIAQKAIIDAEAGGDIHKKTFYYGDKSDVSHLNLTTRQLVIAYWYGVHFNLDGDQ